MSRTTRLHYYLAAKALFWLLTWALATVTVFAVDCICHLRGAELQPTFGAISLMVTLLFTFKAHCTPTWPGRDLIPLCNTSGFGLIDLAAMLVLLFPFQEVQKFHPGSPMVLFFIPNEVTSWRVAWIPNGGCIYPSRSPWHSEEFPTLLPHSIVRHRT